MKRVALCALLCGAGVTATAETFRAAGAADAEHPLIVAGYQALFTCGATFNAARPPEAIRTEELADLPADLPAATIDHDARLVRTRSSDGSERIAAWRPGMGCTVLPVGADRGDVAHLPFAVRPRVDFNPRRTPWPRGDHMDPPPPHPALDAVLDAAFDPDAAAGEPFTTGVVVVRDGRIIAERYRDGFDPWTGYRTWSTAKSITQALIGILVRDGLLTLDAPAPIPEWQDPGDPRAAITLRHLLQMSSGLQSEGSNSNAVYFGGQDVIEAATTTTLEAEPGTRWRYANNDTLLLLRATRHVIDDDLRYLRLPYRELLHPLGMLSTVMETDAGGNFVGSSQVYTTARDLARFGLLYLGDGVFDGRRILPAGWAELASSRAPAFEGDADAMVYGHQFWLLDHFDGIPEGSYTTAGHKGQFATVVPAADLVIVRTGIDPAGTRWAQQRLLRDVLAALDDGGR